MCLWEIKNATNQSSYPRSHDATDHNTHLISEMTEVVTVRLEHLH